MLGVTGGENTAGCNLPLTKPDLPPTIYLCQTTEVTAAAASRNLPPAWCGQLLEVYDPLS